LFGLSLIQRNVSMWTRANGGALYLRWIFCSSLNNKTKSNIPKKQRGGSTPLTKDGDTT